MKYRSPEQLNTAAIISSFEQAPSVLTRYRLARWAELLKSYMGNLHLLTEVETSLGRTEMRTEKSPLAIAFADALFRAQGLSGDTYEEARRFFNITHTQMHRVVCSCFYGRCVVPARDVADQVQRIADRMRIIEKILAVAGVSFTPLISFVARWLV